MISSAPGTDLFRCLTPQSMQPKLRLTRHMSLKVGHIRILSLLLALIFLGAQFHYCADLSSAPSGSHVCPLCSTVGSVVTPSSPSLTFTAVMNRLEVLAVPAALSPEIPHAVAPRAPPAV